MISVIIINYKLPQMTIACVKSIIKYTSDVEYEVIIIDNGSGDDSYEQIRNELSEFGNIKIVQSYKNLGFGGGNILGVQNAQGSHYFFLNNDTLFFENSLLMLYNEYKTLQPGFIQPRLYLDINRTNVQKTCAGIPSFWNLLQENIPFLQNIFHSTFDNFRYTNWDRNSSKSVGSVCGAAMMCSKQDYDLIGGFDRSFFMYFEEYDLHTRIKGIGKSCYYTIATSIIHLHNQSPSSTFQKKKMYVTSFLKYITKHYLCLKAS